MTLDEFAVAALTVPYVVKGRSFEGWDCWGLVYCAYAAVRGISLNTLNDEYTEHVSFAELMTVVDVEKQQWFDIKQPAPMDIGLYRVGKFHSHVSLVLSGGRMLHCESTAGTINERLDGLMWSKRNVGYLRYQGCSGAPSAKG